VGRAIHRYCVYGERSTCKFWGGGQNFGTVAVGSSGDGDSGLVTGVYSLNSGSSLVA
jgi:hypothetical protein